MYADIPLTMEFPVYNIRPPGGYYAATSANIRISGTEVVFLWYSDQAEPIEGAYFGYAPLPVRFVPVNGVLES